jgi:arylformamidase
MRFYDITVPISNRLPVYPGDLPVKVTPVQSFEAGDGVSVSHLSLTTHIGTHIDPPAHFLRGGRTIDQLSLPSLIGPCRVIETGDVDVIDAAWLAKAPWEGVSRLLFKTKNGRFWPADPTFHREYVHLEVDAARLLVERGVCLVGIDYLSVEKFDFEEPVTHRTLLAGDVVIVEGLDLREVPAGDYDLFCLPLRIDGGDGAPARVVLRQP